MEGIAGIFAEESKLTEVRIVVVDDKIYDIVNILQTVMLPKLSFLCNCNFFVEQLREVSFKALGNDFKDDDVFLIIGGAGGVGNLLAKHIVGHFNFRIIITGCREIDYVEHEKLGSNIEYMSCDITDRTSLEKLLNKII